MKRTNFQAICESSSNLANELVQRIDLTPAVQIPMYAFKGVLYGTFEEAYQRAMNYLNEDVEVEINVNIEADPLSNLKEWH